MIAHVRVNRLGESFAACILDPLIGGRYLTLERDQQVNPTGVLWMYNCMFRNEFTAVCYIWNDGSSLQSSIFLAFSMSIDI